MIDIYFIGRSLLIKLPEISTWKILKVINSLSYIKMEYI